MKFDIVILRYQPTKTEKPYYQTYSVDAEKSDHILTVLDRIKWTLDGTLTYRKNCRNVICGSCGMRINGRAALACKQTVGDELKKGNGKILIEPMGNMPVVKDLVVDMGRFWHHLEAVRPWLETNDVPQKEHIVSKAEREHLDQVGNCIMCGACYSDCNSEEVEERFLGPAALAKAYRYARDSRDVSHNERLHSYDKPHGIWDCTHCFECVEVCPKDVAPMEKILAIREKAIEAGFTHNAGSRHSKAFTDSVRHSGWLNEATLPVFSAGFNLRELFALIPMGLRMLKRRKMPSPFHKPIPGSEKIRRIFEKLEKR